MRPSRLALAATLATAAFAVPGAAHAEYDCPGRNTPQEVLEPTVCAGTTTDGWGGPMYAYAGTCHEDGTCTLVTVPVEEIVVTVGGVVNDVWQKITP